MRQATNPTRGRTAMRLRPVLAGAALAVAVASGALLSGAAGAADAPGDDPTLAAGAPDGATPGDARGLPRWEWGLGVGGAWVRDYPGSNHSDLYALPYPWFTWRSERVELGREGGRGVLYRAPGFALDFTLAANPPSDSGDNPERAGMGELDAVLEPGLRARFRYTLDDAGAWRLDLRLPVRVAYGVGDNFHTYTVGVHSEPGVSLEHRLSPAWSWSVSAAVGFAEKGYADYYYGVAPAFATPWRPAYEAEGGYAGWQAGARLSYRHKNYHWGLFARVENVAGASFADSPLVSTPWGKTVGANIAWRLGQSRHRIAGDAP